MAKKHLIPPVGRPTLHDSDRTPHFDLFNTWAERLSTPTKKLSDAVWALHGDPGAGKSTCLKYFEEWLWTKFSEETHPIIPLYVSLCSATPPLLHAGKPDIATQSLLDCGCTEGEVQQIKSKFSFVLTVPTMN